MKKFTYILPVAALLSVAAQSAWADSITRRSAKAKDTGDVTSISKTEVVIKPKTKAAVTVPANDIIQISWTGEPPGLNIARGDEAGGRLAKALEGYAKAAEDKKTSTEGLKADIQFFIARTTVKMALADPDKLDQGIKLLEAFQSQHKDSYHFYEAANLLGELYLGKQDAAKAKAAFDTLGQAPFTDYKMAAKIASARINLQENKPDDALREFEEVAQMTASNPAEASKKQEAKLGVAKCLQLQKDFEKATKLLDEVIAETAPEDSRVQAEAHLRQGDCLQAAGKPKEALFAYLAVDVVFATEKAMHAEALYHLSRLWEVIQQPNRAADAADRLAAEYPNSPWAQRAKAPPAE